MIIKRFNKGNRIGKIREHWENMNQLDKGKNKIRELIRTRKVEKFKKKSKLP